MERGGEVWRGTAVKATLVEASLVSAGLVVAGPSWKGVSRRGADRNGRQGTASLGREGKGSVRLSRLSWIGPSRNVWVQHGQVRPSCLVAEWNGLFRSGRRGMEWNG